MGEEQETGKRAARTGVSSPVRVAGGLPDLSAAILAGGKSSRFGSDKALADVGGEPLIACVARRLRGIAAEVLVIGGDPAAYRFLGVPCHPDLIPGAGAISGLHAALGYAAHARVFVVACDMPGVEPELVRLLLSSLAGHDAAIPCSDSGPEPLHAVYERACLEVLEEMIRSGEHRLRELPRRLSCRLLSPGEVASVAGGADPFENLNSPQDHRALLARLRRR